MLSPEGERIAYAINETDDFDNRDVYAANADGSEPQNLEIGETGVEATPADWGPDGDRLLVSDNTEDRSRCGVYDFETGTVRWLGDLAHEETPEGFTDDGTSVLATRTRDAVTIPIAYDLDSSEARELDLPEGVAGFGMAGDSVLDDGRAVVLHTTPTRAGRNCSRTTSNATMPGATTPGEVTQSVTTPRR